MRPLETIRTTLLCLSFAALTAVAPSAGAQPDAAPEDAPSDSPAEDTADAEGSAAPKDDPAPDDPAPDDTAETEPTEAPSASSDPSPETAPAVPGTEPEPEPTRELNCGDRIDNDDDSMVDCADADCTESPACIPNGDAEITNLLCTDWIDNDRDGHLDCDDPDCNAPSVTACRGSYPSSAHVDATVTDPPSPQRGERFEDLIGKGGDIDGERNDVLCSDGVDNDNDGRTDCEDIGCRFDNNVHVCTGNPGIRFSVVAQVAHAILIEDTSDTNQNEHDTYFKTLQLRAFGPIPRIADSFFLVSMRVEKSPRTTFAMFQLPILHNGHYVNINSGGGGLSSELIVSASKHLLLEPAYYVYNAFEQGNGAAIDIGGPLAFDKRLTFRTFAAGGSGRYSGNVGGRFFADDNTNYTWAAGGQVAYNFAGYYSRLDTEFLYTYAPLTLAVEVGAKYDQRAQERYPAGNVTANLRYGPLLLRGEVYGKRELEFESTQVSYKALVGVLVIPRHIMVAADYGAYLAGDLENPPASLEDDLGSDVRRQRDEQQFRAIAHWYAYQSVGILSVRYSYRDVKNGRTADDGFSEQELLFAASYRF